MSDDAARRFATENPKTAERIGLVELLEDYDRRRKALSDIAKALDGLPGTSNLDAIQRLVAAQEPPKTCATCRHFRLTERGDILACRRVQPFVRGIGEVYPPDYFGCSLWEPQAPRAGETR